MHGNGRHPSNCWVLVHRLLLSLLTKFLNYSVSLVTQTVTWILFILLFLNSALQFFDLQLPKSLFYLCQLVSFLINSRTVIMSCSTYLKKCILDKDNLSNYRSTSHLSVLSKLTDITVQFRLADYFYNNNLLNSFQSAYILHFFLCYTLLLSVLSYVIHLHIIITM